MPEKSHLKFLNEKQISEIKDFKYNYDPISNEDEDSVPKKIILGWQLLSRKTLKNLTQI